MVGAAVGAIDDGGGVPVVKGASSSIIISGDSAGGTYAGDSPPEAEEGISAGPSSSSPAPVLGESDEGFEADAPGAGVPGLDDGAT